MQKRIEGLLVTVKQGIEFMRKGKNYKEVRSINDLCPVFVYPDFFIDSLAVRTVTVAAGIIMKIQISAVWALGNIYPQFPGFTVQDCIRSFCLYIRDW